MNNQKTRNMSTSGQSLYEILEIQKSSTSDEIKKAYRKLALRYHPDKNPNNPEATEKFQDINRANTILSDEKKRDIYDHYGSLGLYVADTFGDDNVRTYFIFGSKWCKGLMVFCCVISGCCCCCCFCCFCCFNFCCGKFKPASKEDADFMNVEELSREPDDGEERRDELPVVVVVTQPQSTINGTQSPAIALQPNTDCNIYESK